MGVVRRLVRRAAGLSAVLLVLSFLTFLLIELAPGDVASTIARRRAGVGASASQIASIRRELGLDGPIWEQFWHWLLSAIQGDFGISLRTGRPIVQEIGSRFRASFELVVPAMVLASIFGLGMGLLGASKPGTLTEKGLRTAALATVSIPNFVVAYFLIFVFGLELNLFPVFGRGGIDSYALPILTLALPFAGALSRVTRSSASEGLRQSFVATALSKGLGNRAVVLQHVLPNVSVPLVNLIGVQFSLAFAATVVIETIFTWPGIGDYFLRAVAFRDIPAVQISVLLFALVFVATSAVVDVVQAMIDPRLREAR